MTNHTAFLRFFNYTGNSIYSLHSPLSVTTSQKGCLAYTLESRSYEVVLFRNLTPLKILLTVGGIFIGINEDKSFYSLRLDSVFPFFLTPLFTGETSKKVSL